MLILISLKNKIRGYNPMIKILESKKLIEKQLDDVLTGRLKYSNQTVVQNLARYGLDIENTNFIKTDPSELKKNQNILFVFAGKNYRGEFFYKTCLYKKGEKVWAGELNKGDTYLDRNGKPIPYGNKDLSTASFKFLVTYCHDAYVLDDELVMATEKRKQRSDAKKGSIERDTLNADTTFYGGRVDKSGYTIDKNKYQKMLAAVHKDSYRKYFDEAIDLYNAAKNILDSDLRGQMSLDSESEPSKISYADKKELTSFVNNIQDLLISFTNYFRQNNVNMLVWYSDKIKDSMTKYRDTVKEILSK